MAHPEKGLVSDLKPDEKHRDTKTKRHKGAQKKALDARLCASVSLCLCVFLYSFEFEQSSIARRRWKPFADT
jgi:hypothetical protein